MTGMSSEPGLHTSSQSSSEESQRGDVIHVYGI